MTPGRPGLEDAKRVPVLDVARELRLEVHQKQFASYTDHSFGPCPSCGGLSRDSKERRTHEKRLRCRVSEDGQGWKCYTNGHGGCETSGDGPGLVNWHLHGHAGPRGSELKAVLDWYEANHLLGSGAVWNRGTPVPGPVVSSGDAEAPSPVRPPLSEVRDVWERLCVPVTEDAEVSAWLRNRHDGALDPELIARLELAKALKPGVELPEWCKSRTGRRWNDAGYRLIVRLYGPNQTGPGLRTLSLHARNVLDLPDEMPKGVNATDYSPRGLVMAWSSGLPFLLPMEASEAPVLEIAEGVPDWLRLASARSQAFETATGPGAVAWGRPVVWGCVVGSAGGTAPKSGPDWRAASKVPDGWVVWIRTHDDPPTKDDPRPGEKMVRAWNEALPRGCQVHEALIPNPKKPKGVEAA